MLQLASSRRRSAEETSPRSSSLKIALERIARLNSSLNAFITIDAGGRPGAAAKVAEAEIAAGKENIAAPLQRHPDCHSKTCIKTAGLRTTGGLAGSWPITCRFEDATVTRLLRQAGGAILLGKEQTCTNSPTGPRRSIHITERFTIRGTWIGSPRGGSSGGLGRGGVSRLAWATRRWEARPASRSGRPAAFLRRRRLQADLRPKLVASGIAAGLPGRWTTAGPLTRDGWRRGR